MTVDTLDYRKLDAVACRASLRDASRDLLWCAKVINGWTRAHGPQEQRHQIPAVMTAAERAENLADHIACLLDRLQTINEDE